MKSNRQSSRRTRVTRRGFMVAGAAVAAGLSTPAWAAKGDPVIEFARESCGPETARPRLLVGYASCCGSTGGIAQAIGRRLCAAGAKVDVQLMKEVKDLSVYDGLVLGSAIQEGQWLPEARKFIDKHQEIIASKKVAFFIACLALSEDKPNNRKIADKYLRSVIEKAPNLKPVAMQAFAGAVFYDKMPKKFVPVMKLISPKDGDYRNWDAINTWADGIVPSIISKG
jgi:menaquinone-dependent protoporphyrinogen oxidase